MTNVIELKTAKARDAHTLAAESAVTRSVQWDEAIVLHRYDAKTYEKLVALAAESFLYDGYYEFLGDDRHGNAWRVHMPCSEQDAERFGRY
jgi:hypothetical protein